MVKNYLLLVDYEGRAPAGTLVIVCRPEDYEAAARVLKLGVEDAAAGESERREQTARTTDHNRRLMTGGAGGNNAGR